MPRRRQGFSLIEIAVAVAVLAILAGLLVVGLNRVGGSAKGKATRATLETAQLMFDELKSSSRRLPQPGGPSGVYPFTPLSWVWIPVTRDPSTGVASFSNPSAAQPTDPPVPATPLPDFWLAPHYSGTPAVAEPLVAPGNVTSEIVEAGGLKDRFASPGVLNTQVAMGLMLGIPKNRSLVDSLPANKKMFLQFATGNVSTPRNAMGEAIVYPRGVQIQHTVAGAVPPGPKFFHYAVATPAPNPTAPTTVSTTDPTWPVDAVGVPVLLDDWNNPIILVPASGLLVRTKGDAAANRPTVIVSPDRQPFFASAGPDGDFSGTATDPKGDDNIYSFEK